MGGYEVVMRGMPTFSRRSAVLVGGLLLLWPNEVVVGASTNINLTVAKYSYLYGKAPT